MFGAKTSLLFSLFTAATLLFCTDSAEALRVEQVRGAKVYLKDSAFQLRKGKRYVTQSPLRRRGLIGVVQRKDNWILAKKLAGQVSVGDRVISEYKKNAARARRLGLLLTQNSNNVKVALSDGVAEMQGSSQGLHAWYEQKIGSATSSWSIPVTIGYESISALSQEDTALCDGSRDCVFDISYISGSSGLQVHLWQGSRFEWTLLGRGHLIVPSRINSNAVDTDKVTTNFYASGALSLRVRISGQTWIHAAVQANSFPGNSETVEILSQTAQLGLIQNF